MPAHSRLALRFLPAIAALALMAGCRDKAPAATDSSLSRDLEMAQRSDPGPMVFNDAPVGAPAPASAAPGAPTRKPEPPRARASAPTPTPRRANPPAQVAQRPSPTPAPAPTAPAPDPGPAAGVIGAGARVGMTTNGRMCARNALVGDKLTATVSSAIVGRNGAVIPAGATVVLEVASVDRADPIEASQIHFRVRAIDLDGVARPAEGEVATLGSMERIQSSSGNERTKVIGGAVAGAVLGQIFGRSTKSTVIGAAAGAAAGTVAARAGQTTDACLPNGSPLQLTLTRDLAVRRTGAI
jgi:hypothetical protein